MDEIKIWKFLKTNLENNLKSALLVVVNSKGSSPGKAGFKMAVNEKREWVGTIGGGRVEFTMVERAVEKLLLGNTEKEIIRQVHNQEETNDSSGMICSGEQTVLIYPIKDSDSPALDEIIKSVSTYENNYLKITPDSLSLGKGTLNWEEYFFEFKNKSDWIYREHIGLPHKVFIFGAGHVCLVLSELLAGLGFHITIIDDRPELDLMEENNYAHKKITTDYKNAGELIPEGEFNYLVIMTHSHLGDAELLAQLIEKKYRYLGMMGSPSKVKEIYQQLMNAGIEKEKLKKVNSPIGVKINSRTVKEIAVSIAAELIKYKNSN